jgi:hypothetical protein
MTDAYEPVVARLAPPSGYVLPLIEPDEDKPLKPRVRMFCVLYATGRSAHDSYLQAGYKAKTQASIDTNAWRLLRKAEVSAYVKKLQEQQRIYFEVTRESLIMKLQEGAELAREARQVSAYNGAIREIAVLSGFREQTLNLNFANGEKPLSQWSNSEFLASLTKQLEAALNMEPGPDRDAMLERVTPAFKMAQSLMAPRKMITGKMIDERPVIDVDVRADRANQRRATR